jgi:hypothetical protein
MAGQVAPPAQRHGVEAMGGTSPSNPAWRRFRRGEGATHQAHLPHLRSAILAASVAVMLVFALAGAALAAVATYVERGGFNTSLQHPRTLSFSVDGDLVGEHLRWRHWGGPRATAKGTIYERTGYPSYATVHIPGTITLTALRTCDGAHYYTRYAVHASGKLLFRPVGSRLLTPCNGG